MFSGTKEYRTKPPVGVMLNPLHPLSKGLVGYWLFNEGAGSVAHDISGHGNHGTLSGMSTNAQNSGWGGSKFGGGLNFDGVNDYVSMVIGNMPIANEQKTITFCAKGLASDKYHGVVSTRNNLGGIDNESKGYLFLIDGNAGGRIQYSHIANGDYRVSPTLTIGVWYHVAITTGINGNDIKIYLNGTEQASTLNTITTADNENTNGYFTVGKQGAGYSNGSIPIICTYNRALSAAEVSQLYEDPFCNLLRVPVRYAPAAAGGLPIPVAMNYYRQRRIA